MIVNWVKEDEELLEPYEWSNGDDIEIISTLSFLIKSCVKKYLQ